MVSARDGSISLQPPRKGGRCLVITLPYELIKGIVDFVPPEFHFAFASTCKTIASLLSDTLELHRKAYALYRVASDQQPLNIPILLNSACGLSNPITAWHVRSFEIWSHRATRKDWTGFSHEEGSLVPHVEPVAYSFTDKEIKRYLYLGREYLRLSEDQIDDARRELQNGGDGFIKTLLISLCPRLQDLKFVKHLIPTEAQDVPERITDESMWYHEQPDITPTMHSSTWLKRTVFNIVDQNLTWPSGLKALRDVAVGIPPGDASETAFDGLERELVSYEVLCSFFNFPNINSIYFSKLVAGSEEAGIDFDNWDEADQVDDHWRLPLATSTLKHLYLHDIAGIDRELHEAIVAAPRGLESVSYRAGIAHLCEDMDTIVSLMSEAYGNTLQSLPLHGKELRGYRCNMYRPSECNFVDGLRQVTVDASDLILDYTYEKYTEHDIIEALAEGIEGAFPPSLEVLNVVGRATIYSPSHMSTMTCLDGCFERVINSGKFRNLKALYLENVERETIKRCGKPRDQFCFIKTITAGRRAGVDVHAVANKDPPKHHVDIPLGLDKYDLKSGPFWGKRPADGSLKFNVATGKWDRVTCSDCGMCETCLALYTVDAWKTIGAGPDSI